MFSDVGFIHLPQTLRLFLVAMATGIIYFIFISEAELTPAI